MPELAFVMSPGQHYPLRELMTTLRHELAQQDVPSSLHLGSFPEPRPDRVYALVAPRDYVRIEGSQALPGDAVLKRTILLGAERPGSIGTGEHLNLLRRAGAVFDIDVRSVLALRRLGIPARTLKPGYSTLLDRFDPEAPRPIDVMFLGAHSLRRTKYLSGCASVLSRRNCLLQISEDTVSLGESSSFRAQSKWSLLAQTKVLVNLHHGDESYFEWLRAIDAIHAGAVVVTEHSSGTDPLVAGEHILVANPESLPFVIDAALRDPERLGRLRAQAHERLRSWLPFALSVAVLRAAAVEIVGQPLPPALTSVKPSKPRVPSPVAGEGDREIRAVRQELKDARLDLMAVSRQLSQLQETVQSALGAVKQTQLGHQTLAWGARRRPQVTVVTAVHDDAESLRLTLDSLAQSWLRDFELVLVDAGSSDSSGSVADQWLRQHPRVAGRLVIHGATGGVGVARNIGVDFSRADYCLILDPGAALYPHCLEVLVGTLDAMPETEFAYPMIEVTGAPEPFVAAGGDYLMSFLGWDPGRLQARNYIHAPVMIRTSRLRDLGGFAQDVRLSGREDYDLWCRMAERGWRGQLVPQILARRTESEASEVLSTMRPMFGSAMSVLARRAPRLMAGAFAAV